MLQEPSRESEISHEDIKNYSNPNYTTFALYRRVHIFFFLLYLCAEYLIIMSRIKKEENHHKIPLLNLCRISRFRL